MRGYDALENAVQGNWRHRGCRNGRVRRHGWPAPSRQPFAEVSRAGITRTVFAAAIGLSAAFHAPGAAAVEIVRDGGNLSLVISEPTPLADVLKALATEFSVEVKGINPGAMVEPMRLVRMTLPQILDRIVPGRSFALVSDSQGVPVRIVIMAGGEGSAGPGPAIQPVPPEQQASDLGAGIEQRLREIADLSNRQDPGTMRQLEELAMRAPQREVRIAALHALGNFREQGAPAFLRTRMLTDPDPDLRMAAAEALQIADYDAARPMIEQALAAERDETQRERLRNLLSQ